MQAEDVLVATSSSEKRNDPRGKPAAFVPAAKSAGAENPNFVPLILAGAGSGEVAAGRIQGKGFRVFSASALRLMSNVFY